MNIENEIKKIFLKSLNLKKISNYKKLIMNEHPKWDSLIHAKILVNLENRFKFKISADDFTKLKSYKDILDYSINNCKKK
tara:strand:- start:222 stop:461 length:240 start_codon:yes stop_codon:yes gene_type:complete